MKFLTFEYNNLEKIGIIKNEIIFEILNYKNMLQLIKNYDGNNLEFGTKEYNFENVKILAPITMPIRNIICLGKNYKDHALELKNKISKEVVIPDYPIYFSKMVDKIVGDGQDIKSYFDHLKTLDYEVELVVIIGKEGKDIDKDKVQEYIFGYTIGNDYSMRELQKKHFQWFKGKSLDANTSMGPTIVTKDEIEYPPTLKIKSFVNNELRQSSITDNLIFDINTIISDFSKDTTLYPGDIIFTGTPAGVGMGFNPAKYLKPGDTVRCEIENIGSLTNSIK